MKLIFLLSLLLTNWCVRAQLSTVSGVGRVISAQLLTKTGQLPLAVGKIDAGGVANYLAMLGANEKKKHRKDGLNICYPLKQVKLTSYFGRRYHPIFEELKFHRGVDLRAFYEGVYAFSGGVVEKVAYDAKSGYYVVINHGGGIKTAYAHLSYIGVTRHQAVRVGSLIAISGNTGVSTAPHLHFAITYREEPVNPMSMFRFMKQSIR